MENREQNLATVLWRNPILRMQMRRRLRPKPVIIWGLLVFIPCLFVFLNVYNAVSFTPAGVDAGEAKTLALKTCFLPMLITQGIILMFLGTGSVAGAWPRRRNPACSTTNGSRP